MEDLLFNLIKIFSHIKTKRSSCKTRIAGLGLTRLYLDFGPHFTKMNRRFVCNFFMDASSWMTWYVWCPFLEEASTLNYQSILQSTLTPVLFRTVFSHKNQACWICLLINNSCCSTYRQLCGFELLLHNIFVTFHQLAFLWLSFICSTKILKQRPETRDHLC